MTPLAPLLAAKELTGWRIDQATYKDTWDLGEGAYLYGGRWNTKGTRVVYASVDPSTAILEVAVHKGFRTLDTVPHVLTKIGIADPGDIHVVMPSDVPNPKWLRPGIPSAGQQSFGDTLLAEHKVIAIPSAVSTHSWNLVFLPVAGRHSKQDQEPFALDTRLHPPV